MRIYFDTEFTALNIPIGEIKLISAGFVAEDGREFYFELNDSYTFDDCSDFVVEHVLPNLDEKHAMTTLAAANKLAEWIESFDEEVQLCADALDYDWALLKRVIQRKIPKNLRAHPVNVYSPRIYDLMEMYFVHNSNDIRHHALCDAHALAHACII